MNGDRMNRAATAAAVLLVALIAAVISFVHIEHLALTHGQTELAAVLLPVSIDGTVAAASLVMLRAAREGLGTPSLARFMLVLAVGATLAANVGYGLPFGLAGAALSGWPAVAFIGCAEMAIGMVRRSRRRPASEPAAAQVAHDAEQAAPASASASVPGLRQLQRDLRVGAPKARQVQALIRASQNGHSGEVNHGPQAQ